MSIRSLKDAVRGGQTGPIIIGVILFIVGARFVETQMFSFRLWRAVPTDVTAEMLAAADPDTLIRRVVRVQMRAPEDVGRLVRENEDGRVVRTDARFFLVEIGARKALVMSGLFKLPADTVLHAAVFPISSEQRRELLDPLTRNDAELRGALLPFSLTPVLATQPFPWKFFVAISLLVLVAAMLLRAIVRRFNHRAHPVFTTLARYGDPAAIEAEIDRELAQGTSAYPGISVLSNYVVIHDGPDVLHVEDLVWLYGVTTEKDGRFASGQITLETVSGRRANATIKTFDALTGALSHLRARAPWALVGLTDDNTRRMQGAARAGTVAEILRTRDHNLGRG